MRHLPELDGAVFIGALQGRERRLFLAERIVNQGECQTTRRTDRGGETRVLSALSRAPRVRPGRGYAYPR